jgi:hypothetical protein
MEPRYIHDCDNCKFMGRYKEFDLYICKKTFGGECGDDLVLRYDSVDSHYCSYDVFSAYRNNLPIHYKAAFVKALQLGLIDVDALISKEEYLTNYYHYDYNRTLKYKFDENFDSVLDLPLDEDGW